MQMYPRETSFSEVVLAQLYDQICLRQKFKVQEVSLYHKKE